MDERTEQEAKQTDVPVSTSGSGANEDDAGVDKGTLIRDAIVFQLKLVIDGVRDLVLIPVSFVGALVSLVHPGRNAGKTFYDIVAFGRETEKQINLFEAANRILPESERTTPSELDGLVDQVEGYMKREYNSARFSAARERIDALMQRMEREFGDSGR
ncbi:MAG: hypothetical protein AAGA84_09980 [Pseudomonadota bacterium]